MSAVMKDKFQQIIDKAFPGAKLIGYKTLEGGVSAQVFSVEATLPNGNLQKVVVRQYGEANLQADPNIATHEFQLLSLLKTRHLPIPAPFYADETCKILPSPFLVIEFIEGQTIDEPADPLDFVRQMADALTKVHQIKPTAETAFLPDQQQVFTKKLALTPAQLDNSLSEGLIRETLAKYWPPTQQNSSVLLHGDFWPGNTIWSDDKLVGVIDWEDAGVGDPLADLGNGRLETLMFFGLEASEMFTSYYKTLMPHLDYSNLPYWDLCAALRPAGEMADWGLDNETLHKLQTGHKQFVNRAITDLDCSRNNH